MKRHRTQISGACQNADRHWAYRWVLPFERMFEFIFEFMLLLVFELGIFVFDLGVATGVDTGGAIGVGVARFVFMRLVLLALFDVASPQAMPRAATDNIAVSAILFIKV